MAGSYIFLVVALLVPLNCLESGYRRATQFYFSPYYHDHMVLQRSSNGTTIWGHSTKVGDVVHIKINNNDIAQTTVDNQNVWIVKFPSPATGNGPYNITASSSLGEIHITDVLFGDVWVCSGQSNMEYAVYGLPNVTEELKDIGNYQQIRLFKVKHLFSPTGQDNLNNIALPWSLPSNNAVNTFSAVCWLYGKYLSQHLNYPIGLVETNWGGTPIESWSSPDALSSCSTTGRKRNAFSPSQLYNGMVYPLLRNTIKGAIWYQGESNSGKADAYACQFPAMINDWRQKFHTASLGSTDANFPFGFVQLAPWRPQEIVHGFSELRWAQTANVGHVPNSKMQHVFMSVAMDLPDYSSPYGNIHPRFKHDIARRLVLSALAVAYHQSGIEYQGPFPSSYSYASTQHTVTVEFNHGRMPIEVRNDTGFEICCTAHGHVCNDYDHGWMDSKIKSHTTTTVVLDTSSCGGSHTIGGVRYAWRESPCVIRKCPVYGRDTNLPGPPFKHLANF